MNNFKSIRVISEADADEYILDDDDSEEELAPRADGEAEFVDLHTAVSIAHPVAGDNQFKSDKDHVDHTGAESDNAEGEDKPVKQGTSGDTKFAQFRDKLGKTPARKGDKSQGDMKAETVKEETLDEGRNYDYKEDRTGGVEIKNLRKRKSVYLQPGDDANDFLKQIEKAKNDRDEDRIMSDYDDVMEGLKLGEDKEILDMIKHYEDMLKSLERKKKKTPGTGFAKIKIKEIIAKLKKDLGEEVELDEAVKAVMMKLKDGKSVKVSPDEAKMFNDVMKELNPENRKRMEMEMMKDQGSYKRMLTFAKRTR